MTDLLYGPRGLDARRVVALPAPVIRAAGVHPSTDVRFDFADGRFLITSADDSDTTTPRTRLASSCQLRLPKSVLAAMDLGPGSLVYARAVGDAVELVPSNRVTA